MKARLRITKSMCAKTIRCAAMAALLIAAFAAAFLATPSDAFAEAAESAETVYLGGYPVNIELYSDGKAIASLGESCGAVETISGTGVSGLGTVTFEKKDGSYRALGHAVTDDTGADIAAAYGYIYSSEIIGAKLPSEGSAGRLIGRRSGSSPIGNILINDIFGLSGDMFSPVAGEECEVLCHDEVKPGKAILCTTVGHERGMYDIEIVKTSSGRERREKSMVIRITDRELLEKTGGILQGMSGSPILQDGKLAGAVTHVFTEDPSRGYAVYAEWML